MEMKALFVLGFVACFIVMSMPVMATYFVKLTAENTTANMGDLIFCAALPDKVYKQVNVNGTNAVVVGDDGARDVRGKDFNTIKEGEQIYIYFIEATAIWNRNRSMAISIDLMYFKDGAPSLWSGCEALEKSLPLASDIVGAKREMYAGEDVLFAGYQGKKYRIINPINQQAGYVIQIRPDDFTLMDVFADPESYELMNSTLKIGGLRKASPNFIFNSIS